MFRNHFKVALRTLFRAKSYTALNVLGLALGLTSVCMIAAWSLDELSYDRFHSKHDRIYRVVGQVQTDADMFDQAVTAPPMAAALRQEIPEVTHAVRLDMRDCIVRNQGIQFNEDGVLFTDPSFFEIFDYPLISGDNRALSAPYSVVLTQGMSRKYFGDENPVGKSITLFQFDPGGNGASYQVTGVVADPPQNAHFTFNILGSFSTFEAVRPEEAASWFENDYYTYVLLAAGADLESVGRKLADFGERHRGETQQNQSMSYRYSLQPLTDIHLDSHLRYEIASNGNKDTVIIFVTIGFFILTIACINYVNLATARSLSRAKEVGVKKVVGAGKAQLVWQFLIEATIVTGLAFVLALIFVEMLQPAFDELTGKSADSVFTLDLMLVLGFIALGVGILSGIYPAFFISAFGAAYILKGSFKSSRKGIFMRQGLVVLQFTIATILVVGIGVIKSQMDYVGQKELGYNDEELLVMNVNGFASVRQGFEPFKQELLSNAAISGITVSRSSIGGGLGNSLVTTIDTDGRSFSTDIYRHQVGLEYFEVYEMALLAGRDFSPGDTAGIWIVNQAAVQAFGWGDAGDALGKPLSAGGGGPGEIVGVVRDFHFAPLQQAIAPVAISLARPEVFSRITIRFNTRAFSTTIGLIEDAWRRHFPEALLEYSFMNDRLDNLYRHEKRFGNIFLAFVVISLAIACLGLMGLAAFAAQQRTKEIGVRKVLGAKITGVIALLSGDFLKLVLLSNLFAWPIAWYVMDRWLQNFAYRIDVGFGVLILAGAATLIIALVTVSGQAVRAALINPVDAIRYE